jgi:hypothetical protein
VPSGAKTVIISDEFITRDRKRCSLSLRLFSARCRSLRASAS